MTSASQILPVVVLLPLGAATLLLVFAHRLPSRLSTVLALVIALSVAGLCAWLTRAALDGPVLHWFSGWAPATSGRTNVVLGISFFADPASAAVATFASVMFAASLTFAWSYFENVHSHFEILMLLFLAAIIGFCLTHDLFNLFVWFELMSVAAFALTAYPLGKSSLEGAFNFTITNAFAGFLMLAGIGLLYARLGTLDFTQMGKAVEAGESDAVLSASFCLIAAALLTKAAIVPFHMWLSDAHAVAPTPVSVIFSGIMVGVALFALAKIVAQIFIHDAEVMSLVHSLLLWLGAATALVGASMAFAQRHLKRLLAFSTIAHLGIMLIAIAVLTPSGLAGFVLYLVGHGLVKGTLFMVAGILLALLASADEIVLYGKGRALWPAGLVMALAGLLLGGLPYGLLHSATELFTPDVGAAAVPIVLSTSLTGAAVLRAAARIFFGLSGAPGPEITAPTEREHEKANRPLWLMLVPCLVLLAFAVVPGKPLLPFLGYASTRLLQPFGQGTSALPSAGASHVGFASIALTLLLFAITLLRERATRPLSRALFQVELLPFRALQFLHSGLVGDYIVWMVLGLVALALAVTA